MSYKAAVIGASGFAGIEACRLLLAHPDFELVYAVSDSFEGQALADVYPALKGMTSLKFSSRDVSKLSEVDVVFLAVPHTASIKMSPKLLDAGVVAIDLSADFRLKNAEIYEQYYGVEHTEKELLSNSFFGLPELETEEIQRAHEAYVAGEKVLVACAGCYPTASSLASVPAIRAGLAKKGTTVIVDAISGVTGAGRKASDRTHFCAANENISAYGLLEHRHTPEMEQIMGASVLFTPHLAPVNRGILSTVTIQADAPKADAPKADAPKADDSTGNASIGDVALGDISSEALVELYSRFYEKSPFVSVLPVGQIAQTSSVRGTNNAQISVVYSERTNTILAICAIDNLCKGAAGQAVQCANIVFGLNERAGLDLTALPV